MADEKDDELNRFELLQEVNPTTAGLAVFEATVRLHEDGLVKDTNPSELSYLHPNSTPPNVQSQSQGRERGRSLSADGYQAGWSPSSQHAFAELGYEGANEAGKEFARNLRENELSLAQEDIEGSVEESSIDYKHEREDQVQEVKKEKGKEQDYER